MIAWLSLSAKLNLKQFCDAKERNDGDESKVKVDDDDDDDKDGDEADYDDNEDNFNAMR